MTRPRVVVGVAARSTDWGTLSWAVTEASATGRHLLVCYACPPESPLAVPGAGERVSMLELAEPAFARAVAAARLRLGGDRVAVAVRPQPPDALLVAAASSMDLIVVGAPVRAGWLERGSTTHQVVRHAPCPVVVVRPSRSGPADSGQPFRAHVVVGVDASTPARAATEFAFAYAAEHHLPLAAVHVAPGADQDVFLDDDPPRGHHPDLGGAGPSAAWPSAAGPSRGALFADEVEPWQHKYPDVALRRAVFSGRPLAGLLRASGGANLLCVGNSGNGLALPALGSVTHGAVDQAPCAVAVVRAARIHSADPVAPGTFSTPSNGSIPAEGSRYVSYRSR